VTDRGEVIAEVSPPRHGQVDGSLPAGLLALARRGIATLGASGDAAVYKALPRKRRGKRTAAQLLGEERGSQ
jgi:hypothetical protein